MAWAVLALTFALSPQLALAQQTWSLTGQSAVPRVLPAVVGLGDGRILITGGVDLATSSVITTTEIHDPATGTTVAAPAAPFAAYGQSAIRLNDGRALVVGGTAFTPSGAIELADYAIFDPSANAWTSGLMPHIAVLPAIATLPNGRVLVAGGVVNKLVEVFDDDGNLVESYTETTLTAADIFDPASNTWTAASEMHEGHRYPGFATMANGHIIVTGGQASQSAEIYDPVANAWTLTAPMSAMDSGITAAVRLSDGRIAHAGATATLDIYDPVANTWTAAPPMPAAVGYPFPLALSDGRVMLAGGVGFNVNGQPTNDAATTQIYDSATGTWSPGVTMNAAHALVRPALLPNGRLAIFGGYFTANTAIELTGNNTAPVANAGADFAASTCASCVGGVIVNAGGSFDADGDDLIYEWRIGGSVVLTTTQPTGLISLSAGPWTVTLTVTDEFGESHSDSVNIVVTNVDDGYQAIITSLEAQVAALTAQQAILEAQLAACQANSGGANITPYMNSLEQHFRITFKDSSFELPGTTAVDELDRLLRVIKKLDKDDQRTIYRALGGRKKHNGHKGRWSSHWDDDCDYDEDDDHDKGKDKDKKK